MGTPEREDAPRANESWPLYTAAELAGMLGITNHLLAKWRRRGMGPKFIREARNCVVYLKSDVNTWLRNHRQQVQVRYPKMTAASKKREAARREKRAAPSNVTPLKRRRRSTRADRSQSPGA